MADNSSTAADLSKLFETWTETAVKFWQDAGKQGQSQPFPPDHSHFTETEDNQDTTDRFRSYKTWESTWNTYSSLMRLMMAPENQEELMKNASVFTDSLSQVTSESLENFMEFQTQLIQQVAQTAERTKSFNYSSLDHTTFESFRDLYKSELQKYFQVPKIGLPREFHEQLSEFGDKTNLFYSHFGEFIYMLSTPFETTHQEMQKKIQTMIEGGELTTDSRQLYDEWVKTLEGHFMQLLKSKEYTEVLNNTISSLADYKNVKQKLINFFLNDLQIPTNKDMDEIYKELYQTKRKLRELSSKIEKLENRQMRQNNEPGKNTS